LLEAVFYSENFGENQTKIGLKRAELCTKTSEHVLIFFTLNMFPHFGIFLSSLLSDDFYLILPNYSELMQLHCHITKSEHHQVRFTRLFTSIRLAGEAAWLQPPLVPSASIGASRFACVAATQVMTFHIQAPISGDTIFIPESHWIPTTSSLVDRVVWSSMNLLLLSGVSLKGA
jgi:hypothetical protein